MSRALASLGRFPEAHDAFNHTVTPAAEDEFAKAPDDPRSRYYAAEAALQHDDPAAAKRNWTPCWRMLPPMLRGAKSSLTASPSFRRTSALRRPCALRTLRDIAPALDGPQVAQG